MAIINVTHFLRMFDILCMLHIILHRRKGSYQVTAIKNLTMTHFTTQSSFGRAVPINSNDNVTPNCRFLEAFVPYEGAYVNV